MKNSTTSHASNNYQPLSLGELGELFTEFSHRFLCVVYCPRNRAQNVWPVLKRAKVPTILTLRDLVSKRKRRDRRLVKQFLELHQLHLLELKTLTIILSYVNNLHLITAKTRPKRLNKRRRKSIRNRTTLPAVPP